MKYNPTSKYTWHPEDKFELSGADFEAAYNGLRHFVNSQNISPLGISKVVSVFAILQNTLRKYVEEGKITDETTLEEMQRQVLGEQGTAYIGRTGKEL